MFRQQAFIEKNRMLKGGLHCHTTRSDGKMNPDDVVRLHKQNGYDFLAITDHRNYNFHQFAPETGVLIIPGMEMDAWVGNGKNMCFHTVAIGPEKAEGNGYEQDQRLESARAKDQFEYQPVIDGLRANGNLVLYCHPEWSSTPARDFEEMNGLFGMEIWNSGCVIENEMDNDAAWWDEVLVRGKRLWGVAVDDGHAPEHHCHGWVVVNAKKNTGDILKAIEDGAFYSSTGPEIYDFYVDDAGVAHVKCSPASSVRFVFGTRWAELIHGEEMTETELKVPTDIAVPYIRAEVKDVHGRKAWTQPIFLKD